MISFRIPTTSSPILKCAQPRYIMDYSKADWTGLSSYLLDYDFHHLYAISDLDTLWYLFEKILTDSAKLFIPMIKIKATQDPKWFNSEIRHEINRVRTIRRVSRKSPTPTNSIKLERAELYLQEKMTAAKSDYETNLVHNFAFNNSCKIYNYIKSFSKQDSLPQIMFREPHSTRASSDIEKANLFNEYFHSVFTTSSFVLPPISDLKTPDTEISELHVSESDVYITLSSLDPTKAPGLDGIGTNILKHCAVALCSPLHHLFSQCLAQHSIPLDWKKHSITPIFKSGDRASVKNYRPISLLSCTSKVLERIIFNQIVDHITDSVITKFQFGFLRNHSSIQQLLIFLHSIYNSHLHRDCTDVIYLDIRKAFDSVSHPELLYKLWSSGITGNLWMWFRSYLSERMQCVTVNSHPSKFLPVLSGVPQGSILGPLLFLIYMNDLTDSIKSSSPLMFADDTKFLRSVHSSTDTIDLQSDLDAVGAWSADWNLLFNSNKCVHVRFLPTSDSVPNQAYFVNDSPITTSDHHKDLGVIMSGDLSWSDHYHFIVSKAIRSLGMIKRTFKCNSVFTKRQLYLSLVRSNLSYCSPIWRPHLIKDMYYIERVQKRATKYILNNYTSDYKSRLKELHILPLMYFFEMRDIMFLVKSIKDPASHFNINDYISFSNHNTRSSYHLKLMHTKLTNTATNSFRNFYFNRIPRIWNSLPPINIDSSISTIKSGITKFLWEHFDSNFDPSNTCTFHFVCPCSKCISSLHTTNFHT